MPEIQIAVRVVDAAAFLNARIAAYSDLIQGDLGICVRVDVIAGKICLTELSNTTVRFRAVVADRGINDRQSGVALQSFETLLGRHAMSRIDLAFAVQ